MLLFWNCPFKYVSELSDLSCHQSRNLYMIWLYLVRLNNYFLDFKTCRFIFFSLITPVPYCILHVFLLPHPCSFSFKCTFLRVSYARLCNLSFIFFLSIFCFNCWSHLYSYFPKHFLLCFATMVSFVLYLNLAYYPIL